jgi:hypothetical protein
MLDRLTVLGTEIDPKLAELFARTDPRRGSCTETVPPGPSADWIMGTENARLRGTL